MEICLCIDHQKLSSITVHDAFSLPWIDDVLQAIHSSMWFSSFDLALGYLQLVMEEGHIKKTTLRARSSRLYWFTRIPFRLLNVGQCLGDQQFITLLLYLDDICIFTPSIDSMIHQTNSFFGHLKDFNLNTQPKNCHFFFKNSVVS